MNRISFPISKEAVKVRGSILPNFVAVYRKDISKVLAVVSKRHKLVSHGESLGSLVDSLGADGWEFKKVHVESSGAVVHIEARGVECIKVGGEGLYPRLVISNSLNRRGSLNIHLGYYSLDDVGLSAEGTYARILPVRITGLDYATVKYRIQAGMDVLRGIASEFVKLKTTPTSMEYSEGLLGRVVGKRVMDRVTKYLDPSNMNRWSLYNVLAKWLEDQSTGEFYKKQLKSQMALRLLLKQEGIYA